jgi:hypothetical protein
MIYTKDVAKIIDCPLIYCIFCTDYVAIGPRFSNLVLQALLVLLRKIPPVVVSLYSLCDTILYVYSYHRACTYVSA